MIPNTTHTTAWFWRDTMYSVEIAAWRESTTGAGAVQVSGLIPAGSGLVPIDVYEQITGSQFVGLGDGLTVYIRQKMTAELAEGDTLILDGGYPAKVVSAEKHGMDDFRAAFRLFIQDTVQRETFSEDWTHWAVRA